MAKHAAKSAVDAVRHKGRAVPDHNGEPSCGTCGWSPSPDEIRGALPSRAIPVTQWAAISAIARLHVAPAEKGGESNG